MTDAHFNKGGSQLVEHAERLPVRCFLNAFCKLCDAKPEIRQQVACKMHIRAQARDLAANDPSNDEPMDT